MASAGFHGGGAGAQGLFEELFGFGAESFVIFGELRERVERPSTDDGAAVIEITADGGSGAFSFACSQFEARNHLREMPAHLDLFSFSEQAEELRFVAAEEARVLSGDLFGRVSGTHAHYRIRVPKAINEFAEESWLFEYEFGDSVGTTERAPVGAFEQSRNFVAGHRAF